ncbi:hypothetical protein PENTCL1PPCAC_19894, partial [Pristionchus entomophagus]
RHVELVPTRKRPSSRRTSQGRLSPSRQRQEAKKLRIHRVRRSGQCRESAYSVPGNKGIGGAEKITAQFARPFNRKRRSDDRLKSEEKDLVKRLVSFAAKKLISPEKKKRKKLKSLSLIVIVCI